ncbi:MAG: DUF4383 domain-containing protein [Pseudonocardiaceae bacterium]
MSRIDPAVKFGIRGGGTKTVAQRFSLAAGVTYMTVGVVGFFVTGFSNITEMTDHKILGIFMLNPYHNIVHIAIGALWLLGALALTAPATEGLNFAIAGVYLLATVLGWFGYLSLLSIPSGPDPDQFLHLVTAVATLVFGCGLLRATSGQTVTA